MAESGKGEKEKRPSEESDKQLVKCPGQYISGCTAEVNIDILEEHMILGCGGFDVRDLLFLKEYEGCCNRSVTHL